MRKIVLLVLISFSLLGKAQDTFSIYLTSDICTNNNLLLWNRMEAKVLEGVKSGKVKLFADSTLDKVLRKEALADRVHIHYFDNNSGKEERGPEVESMVLVNRENCLELISRNPFNEQPFTIGFIHKESLFKVLNDQEKEWLEALANSSEILNQYSKLDDAKLYSYSIRSWENLQREFHAATFGKTQLYNDSRAAIEDTVAQQQVMEFQDILFKSSTGADSFVTNWMEIPEQQKWKGFLVHGNWEGQLAISYTFLLIHPETKYAGYDPGRIVWYGIPQQEFKRIEKPIEGWVSIQTKLAILYAVNPKSYTSEFFEKNYLPIKNTRY